MQFLSEPIFPISENYLSSSTQSLLFEVTFWTLTVLVWFGGLSRILRSIFRKLPIWNTAKYREGVFCGNGRDDSILLMCFGSHHVTAGLLMYIGLAYGDAALWRHGYLLETGFEVADLFSMLFQIYPHRHDGVKPEMQAALMFHHIPGIMLSPFVINFGLYENVHLQAIGMWLLIGAAVSCFGTVCLYTLDLETKTGTIKAGVLMVFNVLFFIFCRWFVFVREALLLLEDVASHGEAEQENDQSPLLRYILYAGAIFMGIFNLGVTMDIVPKGGRFVMRMIDGGKTPIEHGPVPRSRDSILGMMNTNLATNNLESCVDMLTKEGTVRISIPKFDSVLCDLALNGAAGQQLDKLKRT